MDPISLLLTTIIDSVVLFAMSTFLSTKGFNALNILIGVIVFEITSLLPIPFASFIALYTIMVSLLAFEAIPAFIAIFLFGALRMMIVLPFILVMVAGS